MNLIPCFLSLKKIRNLTASCLMKLYSFSRVTMPWKFGMEEEWVKNTLGFNTVFLNNEFADIELNFRSFSQVFYIPGYDDIRDDEKDRGDLFSLIKHFKLKLDTGLRNVNTKMLREMMSSLREI